VLALRRPRARLIGSHLGPEADHDAAPAIDGHCRECQIDQLLGRLATVGSDGQRHIVPVGYRYKPNLDTIDIGGHSFARRKKFRDVRLNPRTAFVVDEVASM